MSSNGMVRPCPFALSASYRGGDPEPLESLGLPYQISLTIAVDVELSRHAQALQMGQGGHSQREGLSEKGCSPLKPFIGSCHGAVPVPYGAHFSSATPDQNHY